MRVLEAVVAAPDVPVSRVQVLAAGERRALLALGDGGAAVAGAVLAPELFAARAAAGPGLTALVCGAVVLSFDELSRAGEPGGAVADRRGGGAG